ncbi:bifunctional diguanylate cyclase/phosphodiesterase [Dactylosporangium sp. AC04546]|uniref:putative bifunctional diguanylate cyclase/phosphodiesterase n=1 Tax=Dactylosporangium sp. AC04546 TaxID=2862460 RepID=UPI001EE08375|nr:bifunctional diguanylate cyclase/phosphodiesterase [Dactylosporangium sp. AC04546]WVK83034.1 bifunctional diguanylate cyclase/phosphodiesterase [Dactylosporangium sp. AC04546]
MRPLPARFTAAVAIAAALCVAAATVVAGGLVGGPLHRFAVGPADQSLLWAALAGFGVVVLAQLARLRVRAGEGHARLAWGEAAMVVLCVNLPPALVPFAVLAGVAVAHSVLHLVDARGGRHRTARDLLFSVSALTVAGSCSVAVVTAIQPVYDRPLTPRAIAALCAGAVVYYLIAILLVSLHVSAVRGGTLRATFAAMLSSKLLMVIGNVVAGLVVVWACATNALLLLLLPPVLWLLHQFYGNRLREDDDRRTWRDFAEATRDLNRLDESDAAESGIAGAKRLFGASAARVVLAGGRTYGDAVDEPAVTRALVVGGATVGELRLAGVPQLRSRDHMLAAYGDALAAALHDAITQDALRSMSERTTYDAVHDPLTGLYNRVALLTRGNAQLARRSPGDPVALVLLDINDFKEVNNALGHTAGDEVLKVIARRVADAGNAGDLLARLGGDEFAVLVTDLAAGGEDLALAAAVERARKLGAQIAAPMRIDGVALSKEPSVGVVVAAAGEVDLTELLRRADIAMYQAKHGGQPVAWYDPARDDASTDRLALLAELREALAAGEQLSLELQPAVALGPVFGPGKAARGKEPGGEITSVEALLRWQHPRRGRLAPGQFLPVVEASELIGPLTHWVLDRALGLAAGWRRAGLAVPVAVNISARSLAERQLPETIDELLSRYRLPAELLILEITETVMLSSSPVIDDVLARIRRLGVQLAVDDFGTGFSSFTVLTRLPVQEVKIDREFVAQMSDLPKAEAIVRATVDLARRLGLRVVAEGVEHPAQRSALTELGCSAAQGFLFHPPMSPDRLVAVLRERRQVQRRHLRAEGTG